MWNFLIVLSKKAKFTEITINISEKSDPFILNSELIRITGKYKLNNRIFLKIVGENPEKSIV